jgi:hypothetical protein
MNEKVGLQAWFIEELYASLRELPMPYSGKLELRW